jgi:DNA repair protein RecO
MYLKSDAIIIHRRPVMNTSLILRCYTRRIGSVIVLAKGAARRRRKDEPPSIPDLFQQGEVVLWFGPRRDYAILREWTLEDMRWGVRAEYGRYRGASACIALIGELGRSGESTGEYYPMLEDALSAIDAGVAPRSVVWWLAFRALAEAGFVAPLGTCASCGRELGSNEGGVLAPASGGLVCGRCGPAVASDAPGGRLAVPPEAMGAARFVAVSPIGSMPKLRSSPRCAAVLDRMVVRLAEYHLERPMGILVPEAEGP